MNNHLWIEIVRSNNNVTILSSPLCGFEIVIRISSHAPLIMQGSAKSWSSKCWISCIRTRGFVTSFKGLQLLLFSEERTPFWNRQ